MGSLGIAQVDYFNVPLISVDSLVERVSAAQGDKRYAQLSRNSATPRYPVAERANGREGGTPLVGERHGWPEAEAANAPPHRITMLGADGRAKVAAAARLRFI